MDVDKCQHLCKIDSSHYPREAEGFEMRAQGLQKSFDGELQVTIFAATRKSFGGLLRETFFFATEPKGVNKVPCMREKCITINGKVSSFVHISVMYNDFITSNNRKI